MVLELKLDHLIVCEGRRKAAVNGCVVMHGSFQRFTRLRLVIVVVYAHLLCCVRRYVFSTDVARALVETNAIAPLKFMPNEDATFGFWVMGMDLRHVDQPKARQRWPSPANCVSLYDVLSHALKRTRADGCEGGRSCCCLHLGSSVHSGCQIDR